MDIRRRLQAWRSDKSFTTNDLSREDDECRKKALHGRIDDFLRNHHGSMPDTQLVSPRVKCPPAETASFRH